MKKFSSITRVNSRHISQGKKLKKVALFAAGILIVAFLIPRIIGITAATVLIPIHKIESWFAYSSDSFPQFLRDRSELIAQLNDLRSQQSAQSGDQFTVTFLTEENNKLRQLLSSEGEKRILAGVIGRPNKLPYDVLVLDKGSEDGIVDGAPVFIGDDAVIGIVDKVFAKSSVVELVTTPGFSASVYIFGPNIYTNAEGMGGGQLRVSVPQGIHLTQGDLVVLPGVDSGIYGSISVIQSTPTQPEQYGYVSPKVPLNSLRLVSVGDSPLEPVSFEQAQQIVEKVKKTAFEVPVPEHILVTTESSTTATTSTSTQAL